MARLLDLAQRTDPDPQWGDRFRAPGVWGDQEALRRLAAEVQQRLAGEASENGPPTPLVVLLAKKLGRKDGQAEPLLRAAQGGHPEDFWLNFALGEALRERKPAEAVGFYRAALATRPTVATVHLEVGMALRRQGQLDEAMAEFRRAIELDSKWSPDHYMLGRCWEARGRLDEAMAEFRRAIELDPREARAHDMLGRCWEARGRLDEAMAEYRRAIELNPRGATAHFMLGRCWQSRGELDEAMAEYRRAIELDPRGARAHYLLGVCWLARAEYRRAIELDPRGAPAHYELGVCWRARGRIDEAMAEYRLAIEFDPTAEPAHDMLGLCWQARGRIDEATAEYRRAIELDPGRSFRHENLAEALLRSGRFVEARMAVRRGFDVIPAEDPQRPALRKKLELCEQMLALEARLPALLQGRERPAEAERLELARLCQDYGRPHDAVGLYAAAFADRPDLADELGCSHRYNAACAAARAAAELGPDEARLGEPVRAGLRRQALDWLRADLAQGAQIAA
jgi:tetratricopeptide (TPR) repeat protein